MMSLTNGMWINDKYYNTVGCLKAEYCDNNKEKFKEVLQEELMEKVGLITDIQEGYYRISRSEEGSYEEYEFGEYHYKPCEKGKGATLYYFAAYEII